MAATGRELEMFLELVSAYVRRGLLSPDDILELAELAMQKAKALERPRPASSAAEPCCSFCARPQGDAGRLIAGPDVYICAECVRLCGDLVDEGAPLARA